MATNYVQPGKSIQVTAPRTVTPGKILKVGTLIGVAVNGATSGAAAVIELGGVWTLDKATGAPITAGAALYWDDSAFTLKATATTVYTYAGVAIAAAATAATSVTALLGYPKR